MFTEKNKIPPKAQAPIAQGPTVLRGPKCISEPAVPGSLLEMQPPNLLSPSLAAQQPHLNMLSGNSNVQVSLTPPP